MDYYHITNFLDKFKKILSQKEDLKNIIARTVFEEINYPIEKDFIKIKNGIIYISGSPVFCNEIMIHKKNILNKLKNILPNNIFLDIK